MKTTRIVNGKIITPFRIIPCGEVAISEGKIVGINERKVCLPGNGDIDASGMYVSPGFIDIHVHGGGGHDFMDGEVEGFLKIAALHARHGTTTIVPTTLTSDTERLLQTLDVYESVLLRREPGAEMLGLHLEGPYFAMNQRGAQDPRFIRDPDPREYREILKRAHLIARWSAAPERKGAMEFGRCLRENGVLAAIAHSDAVYE
ncbi:MAG: N-acetylglucosamine-6-phosphate deacetylase, partial [Verrucomicrobiaceae bacterium]